MEIANILDLFKSNWKIYCVIAALAVAFGAGYYLRPAQVVEKEKVVYKEKTEEATHTNTHVVQKPDGTVITDTTQDTSSSSSVSNTEVSSTTTSTLPNYSASAQVMLPEISKPFSEAPTYRATVGYRVWGPGWMEVSYNWIKKEVGVGARLEW